MPKTAEEAQAAGGRAEEGGAWMASRPYGSGRRRVVFNRLDPADSQCDRRGGTRRGLPIVVHTGDVRDVEDALQAGVERHRARSFRQRIPDADFAAMAMNGVTYDPTLSVGEAFPQFAAGKLDLLNRSLVQQVVPAKLLAGTQKMMASPEAVAMRKAIGEYPVDMAIARDNLLRAWKAGVTLVTGQRRGQHAGVPRPDGAA